MYGIKVSENLISFSAALVLTLLLTPIIQHLALKYNKVEIVKDDRWHQEPVPLFGGISMWLSWSLISFYLFRSNQAMLIPVIGASMIFLLGLFDDIFHLNPLMKFIGQIIIASIMVKMGIIIKIIDYPVISIPLTILWIVAITNAFNLLDNMDGLSAGIAMISSISLFLLSMQSADTAVSVLSIALVGATLGFLKYNFYPAKSFMGDCGSMFLGFTLSIISIMGTWRHASNLLITMIVPLMVLAVPIFDTVFVSITRKLRGIPVYNGGIDHVSHRLVALGMSQKKAVLTLYFFSTLLGGIAVFYNKLNPLVVLIGLVLLMVGLFCFALFLGEMEAYVKDSRFKKNLENTIELGHHKKYFGGFSKRRIAEMIMDLILISIAFFSSYLIRFETDISTNPTYSQVYTNLVDLLPWVIAIKLVFLYLFEVYKSIWKYIGIRDVLNIVKALTISSIMSVGFVHFKYQFINFSKAVFLIDWMMSILLICGFRFSIRLLRDQIMSFTTGRKKVLIIGAGDAGVSLVKEIHNNSELSYQVAGFVDDNPSLQKMKINGLSVLGNINSIPIILKDRTIKEALIAIPTASNKTIARISKICQQSGIACKTVPTLNALLEKT